MKRHIRRLRAATLIEAMGAIVVLSLAVLGACGYRYYATLDARRADMQITAARIGTLLCESWRGTGGSTTYDPVSHLSTNLKISSVSVPSQLAASGFTLRGSYGVEVNGDEYYAILSWKDVTTGLRALNIVVVWAQRDTGKSGVSYADKTFKLTTYVSI